MRGAPHEFFAQDDGPLLCFSSSHHQDAIAENLGFVYCSDAIISNCNVLKFLGATEGVSCIYTTFIRVPGATMGFIRKLAEITRGFRGNVLIVDPRMTEHAFRAARVPFASNYFTVGSATALEILMNVPMTNAAKDYIESNVFAAFNDDRRGRGRRTHLPPQQYRQNRMINSFYAAASRAAPPPMPQRDMMLGTGIVFHGAGAGAGGAVAYSPAFSGDGGDAMFRLAQQMSLDMADSEPHMGPPPRPQRRADPLPTGWQDVLKRPEPCAVGYPECGVCMVHKATILFTECGHMTACDACVRRMFTDPAVRSECPLCPNVIKTKIMRPVTSGVTKPGDEEEEEEEEAGRKRRKRK